MFTGIIETLGQVVGIKEEGSNKVFYVKSTLTNELKIDQSIAHNGTCLTVVGLDEEVYEVVAIKETLEVTNFQNIKEGDLINLERAMPANGRFDGHIVQGHVDTVATLKNTTNENGSYLLSFEFDSSEYITVEKGSICVNGISLTVVHSSKNSFSVAIIPYTWEHTNLHTLQMGDKVNIEFDILGKYVQKLISNNVKS